MQLYILLWYLALTCLDWSLSGRSDCLHSVEAQRMLTQQSSQPVAMGVIYPAGVTAWLYVTNDSQTHTLGVYVYHCSPLVAISAMLDLGIVRYRARVTTCFYVTNGIHIDLIVLYGGCHGSGICNLDCLKQSRITSLDTCANEIHTHTTGRSPSEFAPHS